jgi:3-oxoacid CoA-transferase B subunit
MVDKEKLDREIVAMRAAREFQDGNIVNLGIGIPLMAGNFIPEGREVIFHTENGCLGFGAMVELEESDIDLTNASGQPVASKPGMAFFDHADSFGIVRSGRIDITVLGGMQVSEKGDLANWIMPGRKVGNIGGGMDLAYCAKKVIVCMEHATKDGGFKIVNECDFTLTAPRCVNLIITDIAVIEVTEDGLVLKETAPDWTADDVQSLTEPKLIIDPDLKEMELF